MNLDELQKLALFHGTPLMVIDHEILRQNYHMFVKGLPRVRPFYAIKANPEPEIIRTLTWLGTGFDVASMPEFMTVYNNLPLVSSEKDAFVKQNIIYANTIKPIDVLARFFGTKMLMTFDNIVELDKIHKSCPDARLVLRMDVPNEGSIVELSSKFGASFESCVDLLKYAHSLGLNVEGLSFHVGSQCTNTDNFITAFKQAAEIFGKGQKLGMKFTLLDIGGGFPAPYDTSIPSFRQFCNVINDQLTKYFPDPKLNIIAEPGRFLIATAATSLVEVIGKAQRMNRPFYYVNDGVYGTFSGSIFDHIPYHFKAFKSGNLTPSAVAGPTCDGLDKIALEDPLPELNVGDLLYAENTGAYTNASATLFNGFPLPKVIHFNT